MGIAGVDSFPVLAVVAIAVGICDVLIMVAISLMYPREPGPQFWAPGYMLAAVSTAIMVVRTPPNEPLAAFAGSLGFVLTYMLLWWGYARFLGLQPPRLACGVVLVLFAAGIAYFTFVEPQAAMRSGIVSFTLAVVLGSTCSMLLRHLQPPLLQSQAFAAILLGIMATLYLLRSLSAFVGLLTEAGFGGGPLGAGIVLIPALGSLLLAVATGMMLVQRQQHSQGHNTRTDMLTGLTNRDLLDDIAVREISRARRHSYPLCLMIFDVDHFEAINRRYGYPLGDDALRQLADVLSRGLRREDFMARLDGGSFCILLPSTRLAGAEAQAERLRNRIAETLFAVDGRELRMTASFGVATLGLHGDDWPTLIQRARMALHRAKTEGRNRIATAPLLGAMQTGA